MAIDFPSSPSVNDTYTFSGRTWKWNGEGWQLVSNAYSMPDGTASAPGLAFTDDSNTGVWRPAADTLATSTGGTERMRIDSFGRLLVGTTAVRTNLYGTSYGYEPKHQIEYQSPFGVTNQPSISLMRNSNDTGPVYVLLGKSRGTTAGSDVILQNGDSLATLQFVGATGSGLFPAASIDAYVDGTPTTNGVPGRIVFSTNTSGDSNTERMRIDSAGRVGIGTSSPSSALNVVAANTQAKFEGGDQGSIIIQKLGTAGFNLFSNAAGTLGFYDSNSNTERARIDTSGRLLVGTSTVRFTGYGDEPSLLIEGTNYQKAAGGFVNNEANANGPSINFVKTRGTSVGSFTAVTTDDILGVISFAGANGSGLNAGVQIYGAVDGTVSGGGANDMPSRLVFSTTADGAGSPTERMRIDSAGRVGIGTTSPIGKLHISDSGNAGVEITPSNGSTLIEFYNRNTLAYTLTRQIASTFRFDINGIEAARIDSDGTIITGNGSTATSGEVQLRSGGGVGNNVRGRIGYGYQAGGSNYGGYLSFSTTSSVNVNTEAVRIDSSGRLLVGTSTARSTSALGFGQQQLEANNAYGAFQIFSNAATVDGSYIGLWKSRGTTSGSTTIVQSGDILGGIYFGGFDGSGSATASLIASVVDGTPGANDMPGRLVFSTTADGASSSTERMRIRSDGGIGIGGAGSAGQAVRIDANATGATAARGFLTSQQIQTDVTSSYYSFSSGISQIAGVTTTDVRHFNAAQGTLSGTVTTQYGFAAAASLIGGATNYGFHSDIPIGTNRFNFYANGTANNYMAGCLEVGDATRSSSALSVTNPASFYSSAHTYTDNTTAASGTVAHGTVNAFSANTIAATNTGVTYTNASTLYVAGAPAQGTNVTITNPFAVFVNAGQTSLPLGAVGSPSLVFGTDTNTGLWSPAADTLAASTGGSERLRIDSSGRLLAGTSTARGNLYNGTTSATVQSESTGQIEYLGTRNSADTFGATIVLAKSRGATVGSNTVVVNGDQIGSLSFQGSDGTEFVEAARIDGAVDGAPGANDMPGRLVFSTTADAGVAPTERMRIDSSGRVGIGTISAGARFHVDGSDTVSSQANVAAVIGTSTSSLLLGSTNGNAPFVASQGAYPLAFYTNAAEVARFTSDKYLRMAASTGGIQFNGDTAAANALDDYEEGTFTPTIVGATITGTGTYSVQTGRYTKTGNRVAFAIYIVWSAHTGTGEMRVAALPFTSSAVTNTLHAVSIWQQNITLTASAVMMGYVLGNNTQISLNSAPTGGGAQTAVAMDGSGNIIVTGVYEV